MEITGKPGRRIALGVILLFSLVSLAFSQAQATAQANDSRQSNDVSQLKKQIADQQKQIEELRKLMNEMVQRQNQTVQGSPSPSLGQVASVTPVLPSAPNSAAGVLPSIGAMTPAIGTASRS